MKAITMAKGWTTAFAAVLLLAGATSSHAVALNTKLEAGCFEALGKAVGKHIAAIAKATSKCELSTAGPCPDAKAQASIDKSAAKVVKTAAKKCTSQCNKSFLPCIGDLSCPPNGANPERCTGKNGTSLFSARDMGFPGPFCEALIDRQVLQPTDIGECESVLGTTIANQLLDNLGIDTVADASEAAQECGAALYKAVGKTAAGMIKAVTECRVGSLASGSPTYQADACPAADPETLADVNELRAKFLAILDESCSNATVAELDLCGLGVGGVTTVAAAKDCIGDVLDEAAISIANVEDKVYIDTSAINSIFPATTVARCGDSLANQIPSQFFPVGEECDLTDDSACPGACFPPGDLWQCTCATIKRARTFADGFNADLDNGWSGGSHNSAVTDGAGFVTTMENCDCDEFDPIDKATCIGTSGDSVCDVNGALLPRCTYDLSGLADCDAHGNQNGENTLGDCQVCDTNSLNAGDYCEDELDCASQCLDEAGVATGTPCEAQVDCPDGQRCGGRCDKESYSCLIMRNGAPLPLTAEGTSVCVDSQFATNVTGTRNMVTGEHAVNYNLRSRTFLAEVYARPCATCGGTCANIDGPDYGERCEGTCSGPELQCRAGDNVGATCATNVDCPGSVCVGIGCRFDVDCPGAATCTTTSFECSGDPCKLELTCSGGPNNLNACRVEAYTAFGTTSVDCLTGGTNISGTGLAISFTPLTSEAVTLENPAPCNTPGYQNFDCNCVTGGAVAVTNQPNRCVSACTGGANYGHPCGGAFTKCAGGAENGVACDEDSDCSGGGTCTTNPLACTGGTNEGGSCVTNGDCTGGGTCGDACPGAICTSLCVEKGICAGGSNAGNNCGVDYQCPGSTCTITEPEEGVCAAGGRFRCSGPGSEFRTCFRSDAGTPAGCEGGLDEIIGNGNDYVGAGTCIPDVSNCFVNDGAAEGGDIFNGKGDPTNVLSVTTFCIPASSSSSVNATAGLPGPGRLRQPAQVVPNFTELP